MPGESIVLGDAFPIFQTINWNRANPFPGFENIQVVSYEGADSLRFDLNYLNTSKKWLKIAGQVDVGYLDPWDVNPLVITTDFLDELPNGQYKAIVIFSWTPLSGNDFVKQGELVINITGTPPTQISTDKIVYNLLYNRSDNSLTGNSLVSIINNTDLNLLKFWQNGNVFAAAENFTNSFNLIENAGNPLATNPAIPATGNVNIPAKILKQTGEFVTGFSISLLVIDGGISIEPKSLAYEVFKGTEQSKTLSVVNPLGLNFLVTQVPSWLTLDSTAGNTTKTITATTSTSSLTEGVYLGIIKFEYDGKVIDIPVTLDLKTFISIDKTIDFCLDLPEVKVSKKTPEATIVRMTVTATYNVLGVATSFEKVYSQNYFQDKVLFGLGEKLHRHFPRIKKHFFDDDQIVLMQQIEASIKVEELDVNRNLLFDQTVSGIKLFPGKKPKGYPFLTNTVFRKKNDKAIIFSSVVTGTAVTLNKIKEVDLPNPLVLGTASIQFYDFPKVFQPAHLQWENQNLVPEWFTLTGDFTITPEFNHVYARNIFNAQNEKYDFTKVKTLNISTGLIMAKERPTVEEMIESKLSFIKIGETIYRCFNITKKMTLQDSKEELLSNDLEFLIVEQ